MHRILERQIKRFFESTGQFPPAWEKFLEAVSDTYAHFDDDRELLNRSFTVSSKEFLETNQSLQKTKEELEKEVRERTESFEKYQTLVDNLSIGVYRNTPGPEGHFLEANPAIIAMFEADSKEEFMKHNVSDLYQDPERRRLFVEKITRDGFVRSEELELTTLKGRKIIGAVSAVMRKDKEGAVYFDGVIEDITERKNLEKELQENEEKKFQIIFDNTNDGMVLTDVTTKRFFLSNAAFCRMLGYTPEEIQELQMPDIHPKESLSFVNDQFDKQARGEISKASNIPTKRKDGTIFYSDVSSSPVTFNGKKYVLGVFRDITERNLLEEELLKASADRYKALFVSSRDAVMTLEPPEWRFTSGNPATVEMFKAKDEGDFLLNGPWMLSPELQPDGRRSDEKAKEMIEKAMKEGQNLFEWTHKRLDGKEFPAEVLLSRVVQND